VPRARYSGTAREGLIRIAARIYGAPTRELFTIGITGTNGKTTTTWLIDEALGALGHRPALLGTVEARGPGFRDPSALTTPEGDAIDRFARKMKDAGATHLVMEVSSHALALSRVDGVSFEVAGFTNLTQDHLDFHGTMEAYFEAKARLFLELRPAHACINVDDPWGAKLAARFLAAKGPDARLLRVSSRGAEAEIRATRVEQRRDGMVIEADTPFGPIRVQSPLLGAHNVDNLLLAAACLMGSRRIPMPTREALGRALGAASGAPGRLERVPDRRDVAILVDYAHSPDALEKALVTLRAITPGRLVCVFGCGGDRDQGKRPLMGRVVDSNADLAIVTSDNPRTEDPSAIVAMILPGLTRLPRIDAAALPRSDRGQTAVVDRRAAIHAAIRAARAGDTVLIAGKGHEDYQILGTQKVHFDDREEARAAVVAAGGA
jgi:UDP-N-acetylmuramoyl-L-alanyl-D-glutamate--2,6-diaminopimelate ligase